MTDDFVSSRRRIIGWYADPRWRCSLCKQHPNDCACGTTPATDEAPVAKDEQPAIAPVTRSEWDICPVCKLATLYCKH